MEKNMSTAQVIEPAFAAFESNDVTIAAFCKALAPADAADREALPRVAAEAFAGAAPPASAIEALVSLVDRWGSFIARQGFVGTLFTRLGRWEDALVAHAAALRDTPRWHATSAYRVLDAIADDLLHLGQLEEAVRFAERALRFDPTNPYVLLTLGCAVAKTGDMARAVAIHAYLEACAYPDAWRHELTELVAGARRPVEPYSPDMHRVGALSDDDWARFLAVKDFNPFTVVEEVYRAHSIACLGRVRYDYAVLSSQLAPEWQGDRSPFDAKVVRAWSTARAAAIAALPEAAAQIADMRGAKAERFAASSLPRMTYLGLREKENDRASLLEMLCDPERSVMLSASKALLGLGFEGHLALLEAMATGEKAKKKTGSPWGGASAEKILAARKKKAAGAAAKAPKLHRGVALVEDVIARIRKEELLEQPPRALAPEVLASLKLPGDRPLSPALRAFLAFDAASLGLLADLDEPRLEPLTVAGAALRQWGRRVGDLFEGVLEDLPGYCFLLGPQDGNRCEVLYVGEPDAIGEYPVLTLDWDDGVPDACVSFPGIDVYLANRFEVRRFDPDARKADDRALDEHRRLNLGGRRALIETDAEDDP